MLLYGHYAIVPTSGFDLPPLLELLEGHVQYSPRALAEFSAWLSGAHGK